MEGARPASVYTAIIKATASATQLGDTGPLPNAGATDTHLSLAVESAAAFSGGKFTTLHGGVANWLVQDIEGLGVIDNAQTTIQFSKDGSAHGSTGLNRLMANPTIGDGKMKFGDFPITRRAGPPALMDQEAKFLAAIQKVRTIAFGRLKN